MAPKSVFIVPYRDRLYHKEHFVIYMKHVLSNLDPNSYEIFSFVDFNPLHSEVHCENVRVDLKIF